jgi:hypothetical protein
MAKTRTTIDPDGTGFDAMMQGSDDGGFFGFTEEQQFHEWLDWAERFINIISLVSQRVSLAVASAGFAIAGATMVGTERAAGLGQVSLVVAVAFAVWFAAANIREAKTGR